MNKKICNFTQFNFKHDVIEKKTKIEKKNDSLGTFLELRKNCKKLRRPCKLLCGNRIQIIEFHICFLTKL